MTSSDVVQVQTALKTIFMLEEFSCLFEEARRACYPDKIKFYCFIEPFYNQALGRVFRHFGLVSDLSEPTLREVASKSDLVTMKFRDEPAVRKLIIELDCLMHGCP